MQSNSASHRPTPVWVRDETASRGSSGLGACRSSRSMVAREMIAAAIPPNLKSGEARTDVEEVPAMARQTRATRPAGTDRDDVRRPVATGGRMEKAPIAMATAMAAVATKALRQLPKWANRPPTRGPIRTDTVQLADISAIVRDQADSGKVPRTNT